MHPFVVEGVVRLSEKLLIGLPMVERGIMFARYEVDGLYLEVGHDIPEFAQPLAAFLRVVGGMREIAGEHDEVGGLIETVHRRDGFLQRAACIRIRRPFEAPMGIRQLDEKEIFVVRSRLRCCARPSAQAGNKDRAADSRQPEKTASVDSGIHEYLQSKVGHLIDIYPYRHPR